MRQAHESKKPVILSEFFYGFIHLAVFKVSENSFGLI